MPTVTLAGQDYEVTGLTEEDQASYRAYCLLLARRADRPILRFLREQCEGMSREERQDALVLLPHFPEYLDPPEELVLQWARHPKAVAALARRVLRPKKSGAEWEALLGDDAQGRLAGIPVDTEDRAEVAWEQAARALYDSLASALRTEGVTIRGCERTCRMVPEAEQATEEDWSTEYLDLRLSMRVVDSIDEAIDHIARYGSLHTEAIVTSDYNSSQKFLRVVNSAVVLVNASTRFNDGHQLGLGAEIGISTSKLHAFGPMGLAELTTKKFIVYGEGQVRT